jgi:hypothetical protein
MAKEKVPLPYLSVSVAEPATLLGFFSLLTYLTRFGLLDLTPEGSLYGNCLFARINLVFTFFLLFQCYFS